jgi:hypothetical protein
MCVFIINKLQNTIERADIKRYHLKEYNIKLVYSKLGVLLESFGYDDETKPKLLSEVDINVSFQKKNGFERADRGYPAFLLTYLNTLNEHPELSQNKIVSLVNKIPIKRVQEIWKSYVNFRKQNESRDKPCPETMMRNQENGRCMATLSKKYVTLLKDKPPKPCKENQIYSTILEKCVLPKRNIDVDVLADIILATKYNPNQQIKHIDSKAIFSAQIMTFLMSKYQYAKFILPSDISFKDIEKKDMKIIWDIEKNGPVLKFPQNFWTMFNQHMHDPSCRFIIAMISLKHHSEGAHANSLIYDKATNEFERFDPLGNGIIERFKVADLDSQLKAAIASKTPEVFSKPAKYYEPLKYCPKSRIFQSMEVSEIPGIDLRGNCAVWNWWYINVRIANPSVKRKDIVDIASKKLEKMGGLYKFIKSYQKYMLSMAKKQKQ